MKAVPANRAAVFFAIVIAGCALDLATKHWVFEQLGRRLGQQCHVAANLYLEISVNRGALFGIGQGWTSLFALLSIVATGAILYWLFYAGAARDRLLTVTMGLVTAGILGNLYDRLGLPGLTWEELTNGVQRGPVYAVRDWILVYIGHWPWPTFNLADSMLVCGALLLGWHALRHSPSPTESRAPPP